MYPRYHSNCAGTAPLLGLQQALCSHAAVTGGVYQSPQGRSNLQLGRDGTMRRPATGLPPVPGSLGADGLVRLRHRFSYSLAEKSTPYRKVCQEGISAAPGKSIFTAADASSLLGVVIYQTSPSGPSGQKSNHIPGEISAWHRCCP